MPIVTHKPPGQTTASKQAVPAGRLAEWIEKHEARGFIVESIAFSPDERAAVVLATTSDDPVRELALMRTDLAMARVVEDLFEALKAKGVLVDTDLPEDARQKIAARSDLREAAK